MKEERSILQDVIGTVATDQQKEESKTKKYIRITFAVIFGLAFVFVMIAAAMRMFGS